MSVNYSGYLPGLTLIQGKSFSDDIRLCRVIALDVLIPRRHNTLFLLPHIFPLLPPFFLTLWEVN